MLLSRGASFAILLIVYTNICESAAFTILHQNTKNEPPVHLYAASAGISAVESLSASILKKELLSLIPKRPFGGPATNMTTSEGTCGRIKKTVDALEYLTPLPPLTRSSEAVSVLNGDWQLVYSDASEITRLTKLPFGFCLGPVFQNINVEQGRFENQAFIKHRLRLLSGHTRVLANFSLAPLGATNRVGIVNIGNRANVVFTKVIFTMRRFLLFPTFGRIRKTAVPNGPSERAGVVPCIDVTFLDNDLRISRGGDGSLFVLTRPTSKGMMPLAMLPVETVEKISVDPDAPTYDASVDILPSGSRDRS
jgi:PAP_fibrillin